MAIYFLISMDSKGLLTEDMVKVGYSAGNAKRRHYDVGTSCPFPLELYAIIDAGKEVEAIIRERFAKDHVHKEWYRWTAEMEDWIDNYEIDAAHAKSA